MLLSLEQLELLYLESGLKVSYLQMCSWELQLKIGCSKYNEKNVVYDQHTQAPLVFSLLKHRMRWREYTPRQGRG